MKTAAFDDGGLRAQQTALKQRETSPIWEPAASAHDAAPVEAIAIESEIITLIERPIEPTETHRAGNDRKERDLYALLDRLSDREARALSRRLAAGRASDPVVTAFARISIERRARIITFIVDTRRRNTLRR